MSMNDILHHVGLDNFMHSPAIETQRAVWSIWLQRGYVEVVKNDGIKLLKALNLT